MSEKSSNGSVPLWRRQGARYYTLSAYFKQEFGGPVYKISLDAHFSCPNIDGTVGRGGCVFCSAVSFSPSRRIGLEEIDAQIDDGVERLQRRYNTDKFIAYFQPSTNTHAPLETLEKAYRTALRRPEIVGLAIGTRPDALETLPPDMVVERVAGDAPTEYLLAPEWCANKHAGRNAVDAALKRRDSWQGKYYDPNFAERL